MLLWTVAVTVAGVYPVALAVMLAEPTLSALNVVVPEEAPPPITTGEVPIVPTLGVPLVTVALTDWSPATASSTMPLLGNAAVNTFSVAAIWFGMLKFPNPPPGV